MKQLLFLVVAFVVLSCTKPATEQLNFEELTESNKQVFIIDNNSDTTLTGKQGTQISIPANILGEALTDDDTLKIILREYYQMSDILLAGLSTTSNGKLLETKGMIHLEFRLNNRKITNVNQGLKVKFRNNEEASDYHIFYGNKVDNSINWQLDTTQYYHIYFNLVVDNAGCITCDYAINDIRLDSVKWSKGYSTLDSIVTFTGSGDTIDYNNFHRIRTNQDPLFNLLKLNSSFNLSKLNWINLDKFADSTNVTKVHITSNSKQIPIYFIIFHTINSVIGKQGEKEFTGIPLNQTISVIGLEKSENKLLFGMTGPFVSKENMVINISLKETNIDSIEKQLKEFNR
jgi:hypothetical protein